MAVPFLLSLLTWAGCNGEHLVGLSPPGDREGSVLPKDLGGPAGPPRYGPTVQAEHGPPPLSGGTLAVLRGDALAAAADPDRDRVYIVDLSGARVHADVALQPGDEPGRLVQDAAGRVHVVLRRGGAVVDIDPVAGTLLGRRSVCAIPRGIDYDPASDRIWVACLGGELVALPAAGGPPSTSLHLGRDLRDVVVDGAWLQVSTFRSAEVYTLSLADGSVLSVAQPATFTDGMVRRGARFVPAVAWRMVRDPRGGVLMSHGRAVDPDSPPGGSYYGGPRCDSAVHAAITSFSGSGVTSATAVESGFMVPLDLALAPDGAHVAVVNAGRSRFPDLPPNQVLVLPLHNVIAAPFDGGVPGALAGCHGGAPAMPVDGEAIAVAWRPGGQLLVQTRQPATLQLAQGRTITLSSISVADTGHAIFHTDSGMGLACMSCHPEGGDDGRVWNLAPGGPRRTLSLRGGVTQRTPFHWSGDMPTLGNLVEIVFQQRMGGPELDDGQVAALAHFLAGIAALPAPAGDPAAIARGKELFEGTAGCVTCHRGPQITRGTVEDVGTGGKFKVASLRGLAWRAPYLHAGCARTLADRFGFCGGGDRHGNTSRLAANQIADLVAYLESL